jgi:hypothetical protein
MPQIRSDNDETSTPDTCTGFQGQGGARRHQGKTLAELAQQYDARAKHCLDEASHLSHPPAHELRH